MDSMNIWSPWKKLPITLPDQSQEARAVGYAWAFYKIAEHALDDILEKIPTRITERQVFNRRLAHIFSYTYPLKRTWDRDSIESFAKGSAFTFMKCPYIQTNDPGLFADLYEKGFAEGCRFCYFACVNGLLELFYTLPRQYWWALAIHFAWERMAKDSVPLLGTADIPMDNTLREALNMLRELHQFYLQVVESHEL